MYITCRWTSYTPFGASFFQEAPPPLRKNLRCHFDQCFNCLVLAFTLEGHCRLPCAVPEYSLVSLVLLTTDETGLAKLEVRFGSIRFVHSFLRVQYLVHPQARFLVTTCACGSLRISTSFFFSAKHLFPMSDSIGRFGPL